MVQILWRLQGKGIHRQHGNISETAKKNIRCLDNAIKYLHKDTDLYLNLSQSAKKLSLIHISAGERDILVIYCMGAQEELIFFDDYAKIRKLQ